MMKRLTVVGLMLVVVAVAGVAAASAGAVTTLWLEDSVALAGTKEVLTSAGASETIDLEDMKLGADLLCEVSEGLGSVSAGNLGEVTAAKLTCTSVTGCTTIDTVTPVAFPWQTFLFRETGTTTFLNLLTGLNGTNPPGYLIECVAGGVLLDDTCTKAESSQRVSQSGVNVLGTFEEAEKAKCSLGGEEGLVRGSVVNALANGLSLEPVEE